jgi:septum formation protein
MGKNQSLKTPYPLILASTSKYRSALFSQLGYDFQSLSPGIDEEKIKSENKTAGEIALNLSRLKAEAVFGLNPQACVIGSDQVCTSRGVILSKPNSKEKAIEQISFLQGNKHELLTAVTVICPLGIETFLNRTILYMRSLSPEEIQYYISQDLPLDCAGSYKLESRGIKLFEKIEMTDHTAIIGLPLMELTSVLLKWGFPQ